MWTEIFCFKNTFWLHFLLQNVYYKEDSNDGILEPCDTERDSFPGNANSEDDFILCSQPGVFADVFQNIKPTDFNISETVWEERDT
jgi:hypothetical protein